MDPDKKAQEILAYLSHDTSYWPFDQPTPGPTVWFEFPDNPYNQQLAKAIYSLPQNPYKADG